VVTPDTRRIVNVPIVLLVLVGLMFAIHALRQVISFESDILLLQRFAFVPGRFTFMFDPDKVTAALDELARTNEESAEVAKFFLGDGSADWWTSLTYAFLHGSWLHVGLNGLMLIAFGTPVARRFGPWRFLLFAGAATLAGAAAHYLTHSDDLQPVIGGSAIVSGVTAAAARFAFGGGPTRDQGIWHPALSLRELFQDRRVMTFVVFWLGINFITGLASAPFGLGDTPIAWEAHLGGFLFGLLAFPLFDPVPPSGAIFDRV
jgi:membrane associated rhomboid family serine protease